jgi:hypothetical protein
MRLITGFSIYKSCIQTDDLVHAIQEAYKHYAVQLMFSGHDSSLDGWIQQNLTGAVQRSILVNGDGVPPLLVLICLLMWALGCAGLGIVYGVKERVDATFNLCRHHSS